MKFKTGREYLWYSSHFDLFQRSSLDRAAQRDMPLCWAIDRLGLMPRLVAACQAEDSQQLDALIAELRTPAVMLRLLPAEQAVFDATPELQARADKVRAAGDAEALVWAEYWWFRAMDEAMGTDYECRFTQMVLEDYQ